MAHKTLVGGTAYEITGGKTLVNGTAYSNKSGKTLVGGTAYEVGFDKGIEINIGMYRPIVGTPSGNTAYAKVTINGHTYDGSETVALQLPIGTEVVVYVNGSISVNNQRICYNQEYTYTYIVQKPASIALCASKFFNVTGYVYIYDSAPYVIYVGGIIFAVDDCTWNDLDGKVVSDASGIAYIANIDGSMRYVIENTNGSTTYYSISFGGVEVKPGDRIVPWGYYSTTEL